MNYDFKFSQSTLIEYASTLIGHLGSDLGDFTAFDADLNQEKVDRMNAIIEWFLTEGGDQSAKGILAKHTEAFLDELHACQRLHHHLRYWVTKSFPEHQTIQRTFGIGRISKIADNQTDMVLFMGTLTQQVENYRAILEGDGAPSGLLDEVAVRAEALRTASEAQQMMKGARTVSTSERISQLNELFMHTRHFNAAAEFVYLNHSAKRNLYRPPSPAVATKRLIPESFA